MTLDKRLAAVSIVILICSAIILICIWSANNTQNIQVLDFGTTSLSDVPFGSIIVLQYTFCPNERVSGFYYSLFLRDPNDRWRYESHSYDPKTIDPGVCHTIYFYTDVAADVVGEWMAGFEILDTNGNLIAGGFETFNVLPPSTATTSPPPPPTPTTYYPPTTWTPLPPPPLPEIPQEYLYLFAIILVTYVILSSIVKRDRKQK